MTDEPRPEMSRCVVVGAGIAGLATARALCRAAENVLLLSSAPFTESESVLRQDGIDAALGPDDSVELHLEDLMSAAGQGADGVALEAMARAAPRIVSSLGIPLERDRKGRLALGKLAGSRIARTAHAGSRTALHVSRRLARELMAYRTTGQLEQRSGEDLLDLVRDDSGRVVGVVSRNFATGHHRAWPANRVCFATGGCAGLYAEGFAPPSLGAALGIAARHSARLHEIREVQPCPFAYRSGGFVCRLPARLASLGAKVEAGLLDLSDLDRAPLRAAAGPALQAYRRHTGRDAMTTPIPVVTAPDRSLGGLWVAFCEDEALPENHATTVPGLWAVGGAIGSYHGRAPSSGTPLLAALFGAERTARAMVSARSDQGWDRALFDSALEQARRRDEERLSSDSQGESPFALRDELVLHRADLDLEEFARRLRCARLADANPVANSSLRVLTELEAVLPLVRALRGIS